MLCCDVAAYHVLYYVVAACHDIGMHPAGTDWVFCQCSLIWVSGSSETDSYAVYAELLMYHDISALMGGCHVVFALAVGDQDISEHACGCIHGDQCDA